MLAAELTEARRLPSGPIAGDDDAPSWSGEVFWKMAFNNSDEISASKATPPSRSSKIASRRTMTSRAPMRSRASQTPRRRWCDCSSTRPIGAGAIPQALSSRMKRVEARVEKSTKEDDCKDAAKSSTQLVITRSRRRARSASA